MTARKLLLGLVFLAIALPLRAQENDQQGEHQGETGERGRDRHHQIEPGAGSWRTWVISSGKDFRVPPPPKASETRRELRSLEDLISQNDDQTKAQIAFWDRVLVRMSKVVDPVLGYSAGKSVLAIWRKTGA